MSIDKRLAKKKESIETIKTLFNKHTVACGPQITVETSGPGEFTTNGWFFNALMENERTQKRIRNFPAKVKRMKEGTNSVTTVETITASKIAAMMSALKVIGMSIDGNDDDNEREKQDDSEISEDEEDSYQEWRTNG